MNKQLETIEEKRERFRIEKENKLLQIERRKREMDLKAQERNEIAQASKGISAKKHEKLPELEKQQDEYLDWLLEHNITDPEWSEKVAKYHEVEVKIKSITEQKTYFGGINEVSTLNLKTR